MSTTRLSRSIPYGVLVGGSLVAVAGGAYLLISKLTVMAATITDGTATGVDVYVGQIWGVFGAVLIGVGLTGLALALALGAARALTTRAVVDVVEVIETPAPAETIDTTTPWNDVEPAASDIVEAAEPEASSTAGAPRA